MLEQRQRAEQLERRRVLEEHKWQEDLERKQREDQEHRRQLLDAWKRESRLKRDAQHEKCERVSGLVPSQQWTVNDGLLQETRASQTTARAVPPAAGNEEKSVPMFIPVQLQQETPASSPSHPSVAIEQKGQAKEAHTLEEMNEAASRIQGEYRVHRASRALDDIASQFKKFQEGFAYPRVIDFKKPGGERGHITVPANRPPSDFGDEAVNEAVNEVAEHEGKLDYTSTNYPLHAYSDGLDKLLMKLDEIESRGEKSIREKRRGIVKDIGKEVSRLDWYWKQAWTDYNKVSRLAGRVFANLRLQPTIDKKEYSHLEPTNGSAGHHHLGLPALSRTLPISMIRSMTTHTNSTTACLDTSSTLSGSISSSDNHIHQAHNNQK